MKRVQTVFSGRPGTPYYSNLYFQETVTPNDDDLIAAVDAFWTAVLTYSSVGLTFVVSGEIATIDEVTGDILSVESNLSATGAGANSGNTMPPATQGLIRVLTPGYEGGRRVRGRIFVPSLTQAAGADRPLTAVRSLWETASSVLSANALDSGHEWVVWSKTNGLTRVITGYSAWSEYAVLRSRRD